MNPYFQEQKASLAEERRQLQRAVEKEHRLIVAERAKAAIGKRLERSNNDNQIINKADQVMVTAYMNIEYSLLLFINIVRGT